MECSDSYILFILSFFFYFTINLEVSIYYILLWYLTSERQEGESKIFFCSVFVNRKFSQIFIFGGHMRS